MTNLLQPDPTAIGDPSIPDFAVPPDPAVVFARRARRFEELAPSSPIGPYLRFLTGLADAQAAVLAELPEPAMPSPAVRARAREHEMPPLDRAALGLDDVLATTLHRLFDAAAAIPKPAAAAEALAAVVASDRAGLAAMVSAVLAQSIPMERLAEHVFVAAGLELHATRVAARLDAAALVPVGEGACPACGGPPVASLVVEWPRAHGVRYCACSLCNTLWNYVRIRCTCCGQTKGIGYQEIEGGPGTVKAETCDNCRTYVKVLYQQKDPRLEPVADDVASLGLDMLMGEGPYRRAAFNPYLLGY
ncbi:formate dehydrogenase accessory protein FdhE [Ancylobacter lacus]|uniref:formate dehydrogenase accessory protein FdhE n=1 Tax=Ancylobacter lacus TaxID=2579970 RepID=UPI001BD11865|nr:formate dehydrogenase accessory protein FdhE [Ancylobacter lacus]MBS7538388.1 formate dehydrogenase accessory protein FdhE [Ancylobacter lacus]